MIEAISMRISKRIKAADPNNIVVSEEKMAYAIGFYLNVLLATALILPVGWITGAFWPTVLGFVSFCVLRFFTGGYHLRSLTWCSIVTFLLISPIPHIEITRTYVLVLTIITVFLCLLFAPNMDKETTTMNPKFYPAMKVISVLLVALNFFIASDVVALAFILQGVLIIPWRGGASDEENPG